MAVLLERSIAVECCTGRCQFKWEGKIGICIYSYAYLHGLLKAHGWDMYVRHRGW